MLDFYLKFKAKTFLPEVDEELLLANIKGITLISSYFALQER